MQRNQFSLLRCPHCMHSLELHPFLNNGTEIINGFLLCQCQRWYPIIHGIPRMLPDSLRFATLKQLYPDFFQHYTSKLPKTLHEAEDPHKHAKQKTLQGFGFEWKQFRKLYPEYTKQFLDWISPVNPSFFKNKRVLDAGCGTGRHACIASSFGATVFAIDFSEAVDVAYANTRKHNVHVIQADIYHLPFAPETFDYAYCIGVLHHLPSPQQGFQTLVSSLKKNGAISVWVYGRENNMTLRLIDPFRKHMFSKLPLQITYSLALLLTSIIFPTTQVYSLLQKLKLPRILTQIFPQYHFLGYLAQFPFRVVHSIIFDQLLAPVAFYHTKKEVQEWFSTADITHPIITWRNHNSWRGFGIISRVQSPAGSFTREMK